MSFKINLNPLQIYLYKRPQTIYYALFYLQIDQEKVHVHLCKWNLLNRYFQKYSHGGGGGLKGKKKINIDLWRNIFFIHIKFVFWHSINLIRIIIKDNPNWGWNLTFDAHVGRRVSGSITCSYVCSLYTISLSLR